MKTWRHRVSPLNLLLIYILSRERVRRHEKWRQISAARHWAHKLPVEIVGSTGTVTFPGTVVERMKDAIERDWDRFAFRETPLPCEWKTP